MKKDKPWRLTFSALSRRSGRVPPAFAAVPVFLLLSNTDFNRFCLPSFLFVGVFECISKCQDDRQHAGMCPLGNQIRAGMKPVALR